VLQALGINSGPWDGHEHHYHIDFRTPDRVAIVQPRTLLVDELVQGTAYTNNFESNTLQQLARDAVAELGFTEGGVNMDYAEGINTGKPSIVVTAKASAKYQTRTMGECLVVDQTRKNVLGVTTIDPPGTAAQYFLSYEKKDIGFLPFDSVKIVKQPAHGKLTIGKNAGGLDGYTYEADFGYAGKDRFEVVVPVGKETLRIVYFLVVQGEQITDSEGFNTKKYCPRLNWKISSVDSANDTSNTGLASWQKSGDLMNLLADASLSFTGFSDLAGTAVGQTIGEGANASITLDTNAAGHGWYVDATPWDNTDDYLPTADAGVWQAKTGTAAATQMDLLSVLLHEYGHALGLEHSANPKDFMSASLQPGIRRLPTAAELQLMSDLVAKLKVSIGAGQGNAVATAADASTVATTAAPSNAPTNNPFDPMNPWSALGLLPLGFIRRQSGNSANGDNNSAPASTGQLANVDYLSAANATLINGNFTGATAADTSLAQWDSLGNVVAANHHVILGESPKAQAHVGQAFVITPQDRYLSFTVTGLNLQTNSSALTPAPQDAFEVALSNFNTGAGLGGLGINHGDALLNVQLANSNAGATLQTRAASGVRTVDNPDGSRTYLLDLAGLVGWSTAGANGTLADSLAVNLSFDLIGFGLAVWQMGSQVDISDVRLIRSATVVAVDDAATTAEDNPLTLDVQGNDTIVAAATGYNAFVVAGPQHGTVSKNAQGQFVYTPDANYNGADSFTYQYRDTSGTAGGLNSNVATVSLTITAVNDAPTLGNQTPTVAEDNSLTGNLLATANDVDTGNSAGLTAQIVAGPQHGAVSKNAQGQFVYTPAANYNGTDSFTFREIKESKDSD
jgi:VCBS repeat-containing protein